VNACEVKDNLIGLLAKPGAVCFWQPLLSRLNLVVVAVLRDSLSVVSLLPCVADTNLRLSHTSAYTARPLI